MTKQKIIIDTDPGIDDAVAIAIALFADELQVDLITTVSGNVSVEKVTKNVLKLLPYFDKKIPVAMGASKPIIRKAIDASGVHGETGMDGFDFPEEDKSLLLKKNAVEAMNDLLKDSDDKYTILAIGPLTNIANLFNFYPETKSKIDKIVLMGGSIGRGNSGVYSEFNFHADPEAAKIVFESGVNIVMCGLDVGQKALVFPEDSEKIKKMNKVGEMFYYLFKKYRGGSFSTGLKMYDSCAVAYLLEPSMFDTINTRVVIETKGEYTSGASLVDLRNYLDIENNATVTTDINPEHFKKWFLDRIENCK